jgi:hypothetical protein
MANTPARQQTYISITRQQAAILWNALNALEELEHEWIAQDYTNTLADGTGANSGITKQMVSDVVNTSVPALRALMDEGHATNFTDLL